MNILQILLGRDDEPSPGYIAGLRLQKREIDDLKRQIAAKNAQLAAQAAVLEAHDEIARRMSQIGFEAYASMSEMHELADALKSRKPIGAP